MDKEKNENINSDTLPLGTADFNGYDDRCQRFCGSINLDQYDKSVLPQLLEHFESCCKDSDRIKEYYLIGHTETNTLHIHFILILRGLCRPKTILRLLESFQLGRTLEAINLKKLSSIGAHLRYIVHQDEKSIKSGKVQYDVSQIVSNMPIELIEDYISLQDDSLNTERLINICIECGDIIEVMKRLGLSTYHKYRDEVKTIFNYDYRLRVVRDIERERKKRDSLPF